METHAHRLLKSLAVEWLRSIGCRAIAVEVPCPIGRFRIDVAGWLDHADEGPLPPPVSPAREAASAAPTLFDAAAPSEDRRRQRRARRGPRQPRAIFIECKQSRGDFFRNDESREALLEQRERLRRAARRIEELRIKRHEPHLRRVEAGLFENEETWDFSGTKIGAYRTALARIEEIETALYGRSKFDLCRRYRLADHLFILAPRGLVRSRELPEGWGLLECDRRTLRDFARGETSACDAAPKLRRRLDATRLDCPEARRMRTLRNLAVAASRLARHAGAFEPGLAQAGDSTT